MKYVYLVRAGKGHYKVGIANNMINRVKALQTSNAEPIEIITAKQTPDAVEFERTIHESLESMKLGGGREWFKLTDEQALDIAVLINQSPGTGKSEVEMLTELLSGHYATTDSETDTMKHLLSEQIRGYQELLDGYISKQQKVRQRVENVVAQMNHERAPTTHDEPVAINLAERRESLANVRLELRKNADEALIERAINVVWDAGRASTSLLQRRMAIGYGKAARIIEELEHRGLIGAPDGSRPRAVYESAIIAAAAEKTLETQTA